MTFIDGGVTAAPGFMAAGAAAGIRKNKTKKDLALIMCETPATAAAVYTQNLVQGAPITVTKAHLQNGTARAVIVNSGIANTCAADGVEKAEAMCRLAAAAVGCDENDVIVASTGVIGPSLDLAPIEAALPALAAALSRDGADAAEAILTTDTHAKTCAVRFELDGKTCIIGGMAKGSGMIAPNMATLLAFVTTDAAAPAPLLTRALHAVTRDTFNMLTIDGDTSTNDMLTILAGDTGAVVTEDNLPVFEQALHAVCESLVKQLAADGEGATKLLTCAVTGAGNAEGARKAAKAVVSSALVKTAMFGADANWGRVLCAIGYSGAVVDVTKVDVDFESAAGTLAVCRAGAGISFNETEAKTVLGADEITISVTLHDGAYAATAWGCDLTYDYVKINGDYRT